MVRNFHLFNSCNSWDEMCAFTRKIEIYMKWNKNEHEMRIKKNHKRMGKILLTMNFTGSTSSDLKASRFARTICVTWHDSEKRMMSFAQRKNGWKIKFLLSWWFSLNSLILLLVFIFIIFTSFTPSRCN